MNVLPVPVAPSSVWCLRPFAEAVDEALDRLRLVAGRLERGDEPEVGHGPFIVPDSADFEQMFRSDSADPRG